MKKTTKQILIEARERISKKENWTQRSMARDADGNEVNSGSLEATCWCSLGAIASCAKNCDDMEDAYHKLIDATGFNVAEFNDTHTHEQVLAAFDKAIAACPE